ncbi:MAG: hypothetical protein PHV05_12500 [Candidatus Riflebacteria bacterium]|nr:hypothetical protein [Candidatus Riflebacteria bacterium]
MLDRIDKLVFYFTIECANCKNVIKTSHVVVDEKEGVIFCSLCGKDVKVPDYQTLVTSAKSLNNYIGDAFNSQYINLVLNEKFAVADSAPPAH